MSVSLFLSRLYNLPALAFLRRQGLQPGMILLAVGSGIGPVIWLPIELMDALVSNVDLPRAMMPYEKTCQICYR